MERYLTDPEEFKLDNSDVHSTVEHIFVTFNHHDNIGFPWYKLDNEGEDYEGVFSGIRFCAR